MEGFFSESEPGSEDGDAMEDMFSSVAWHAAPQRVAVSDLVHAPNDRLAGVTAEGASNDGAMMFSLWDPMSLEPSNLLRRTIFENHPELYIKPERPKRRRGKGDKLTLGEVLFKLQANPESPGLGKGSYDERKAAFDEFVRVYGNASGLFNYAVKVECRRLWAGLSHSDRYAWYLVSLITHRMYRHKKGTKRLLLPPPTESLMNPEPSTREPLIFPENLEVFGMLCTWNSMACMQSVAVVRAKAKNLPAAELVTALMESSDHLSVWEAFTSRVQKVAQACGFSSWACCMEASLQASEYGRFHLHAFWGQAISSLGWETNAYRVRIQPERLRWDGNLPDVKIMKARGGRSTIENRTIGGLYYCLAKKEGSVFRAGSMQPFEDTCWFVVFWILVHCLCLFFCDVLASCACVLAMFMLTDLRHVSALFGRLLNVCSSVDNRGA